MKPSFTPFRYPGGKTWLFGYVKTFLDFHEIELGRVVEPFAGSASISVGLLQNGLADEARICEMDPLVSSFWKVALVQNEQLQEEVRSLSVTITTWKKFRKYLRPDAIHRFSSMELAVACIFFNRANFSGILKAGPLGGKRQESEYTIKCRFNKEYVCKKIAALESLSGKLHVTHGDGVEFIQKYGREDIYKNQFFYVDPPYYGTGRVLYRNHFEDEDHTRLAAVLRALSGSWLLSYDDVDFVREAYSGSKQQFVYSDWQAGSLRRGVRELLLSNREIPPVRSGFAQEEQAISGQVLGLIQ